jgi:hypothetical protein
VNVKHVQAAAQRFIGLEVDDAFGTSASVNNAIKGVNWLTLIDNGFVRALGGMDSLRTQLGPEILFHPLPNGLMIQAGDRPRIGDLNAGDRLPDYRAVARALLPIRTKKHWPIFKVGSQMETKAWLSRFDD